MQPVYFRIKENHFITGHTRAGVEYQHVCVLLSTLPEITHTHINTQYTASLYSMYIVWSIRCIFKANTCVIINVYICISLFCLNMLVINPSLSFSPHIMFISKVSETPCSKLLGVGRD